MEKSAKGLLLSLTVWMGISSTISGCTGRQNIDSFAKSISNGQKTENLNVCQDTMKDWNILFITSDEHNAKLMGCAGHQIIKTPGIDRLAREGMMFNKAYCADPVCAPTRQSIYTGLYPQEHGQHGNDWIFNENNKTWGHYFKQYGYTTAIIGKTHDNNPKYDMGFDNKLLIGEYKSQIDAKKLEKNKNDTNDQKVYNSVTDTRFSGQIVGHPLTEHDGIVLEESLRYLKENKDNKFFLHVSFVKPHWPWNAPEKFYYMYDPATIDMPKLITGDLDDDIIPRNKYYGHTKWNEITEEQNRLFRARYYASISWLDDNIMQILDMLDELDLTKKTLVIYSTDHGDMAAEKGLWLKNVMFDGAARIPLIMRMPEVIEAGSSNNTLINHVDFFPTIAGMIGITKELPENLSGKNLADAVLGRGEGQQYTFSVDGISPGSDFPKQIMVRSQRWKFIRYNGVRTDMMYVLYDMENDPDEINNLANKSEYADVVREHSKAIQTFLANLKKPSFKTERMNKEKSNFIRELED